MSFQCDLIITGTPPEVSTKAFLQSYNETSKMNHYKKKLNYIEKYFHEKLERNIAQANIQNPHLKDSFSVKIQGKYMVFSSTDRRSMVYEYGAKNVPPRRYLEPSIMDTANEMPSIILGDAIEAYNKYIKFGTGVRRMTPTPMLQKSNKYSKMLK